MLFNSHQFILLFLPALLISFWMLRKIGRNAGIIALVAASLIFYAQWEPVFVLLLAFSIFINFIIGTKIYDSRSISLLWAGILVNLFLIAYFKYRFFLSGIVNPDFNVAAHSALLIIPLGISFFTFQQISFLVDCRRQDVKPTSFLEYAFYVSFFPQLIAGPIVRFSEVVNQFKSSTAFRLRYDNFSVGITLFSVGLFKKVVIADQMAAFANPVFEIAETGAVLSFAEAWTGVLAYTFQIYFDFSAYSDMAIGLSRIFGIRLPLNFNSPYKSTSIIEFWRRWHITLSRFLKDYLYIPLGGGRQGKSRRYANLMIVMLLGGLWHGSDWTFVLWGGLHGGYLIVNHLFRKMQNKGIGCKETVVRKLLGWAITFLAIVVAWVLFRANTLSGAENIYQGMLGLDGRLILPQSLYDVLGSVAPILQSAGFEFEVWSVARAPVEATQILWISAAMFICLFVPNTQVWMKRYRPVVHMGRENMERIHRILAWRPTMAWSLVVVSIFLIALFSAGDTSEFIYWQF